MRKGRVEKGSGGVLPARQERSRETLARLLQATLRTLEDHGLDGATIPRIARSAGVAPASVYRRFRDRDALYRAAFMTTLERSAEASQAALQLDQFADASLDGVVSRLVELTMAQYRAWPGLMRALTRFIETDSDDDFRARALKIVTANAERMITLLLTFHAEVKHPDARRAITFGLLTMATIIEVHALEQVSMWNELLPMSDADLHTEVTMNFLSYLRNGPVKTSKATNRKGRGRQQ